MNTYFYPGDVVTIKQDVNKPEMVVKEVVTIRDTKLDKAVLYGVVCFWFTDDMHFQIQKFNTKDLEKL